MSSVDHLFDHAAATRAGGREVNEDYVDVLHGPGASCWVVADGLGGHRGGAVASKLVVESALRSFQEYGGVTAADVERHVEQAQEALLAAQRSDSSLATMRSTIVVLVANDREAVWGHVGDSRLYHVRGGRVVSRTKDHSVSQALVDGGQIDRRQQGSHEDRSRLLRSLGKDGEAANPTIGGPEELCRDDAFLLCTDGFWEALDETAIEIDYAAAEDAAAWIDRLVARLLAQERPLSDNYTAAAVRVTSSGSDVPPTAPPKEIRRAAGSSPGPSSPTRSSAAASAGAPVGPSPPTSVESSDAGWGDSPSTASRGTRESLDVRDERVGRTVGGGRDEPSARAGLFGAHRAVVMRVLYVLMALTLLALLYTAYVAYTQYVHRSGQSGRDVKSPPVEKGTPPSAATEPLGTGDKQASPAGDSVRPTQPAPLKSSDPNAAAPASDSGHLGKGEGQAPAENATPPSPPAPPKSSDPNSAAASGSGHLRKGDGQPPAEKGTQPPPPKSRDPDDDGD